MSLPAPLSLFSSLSTHLFICFSLPLSLLVTFHIGGLFLVQFRHSFAWSSTIFIYQGVLSSRCDCLSYPPSFRCLFQNFCHTVLRPLTGRGHCGRRVSYSSSTLWRTGVVSGELTRSIGAPSSPFLFSLSIYLTLAVFLFWSPSNIVHRTLCSLSFFKA